MAEKGGKNGASSPLNEELKIIKRVAKALDGLSVDAKRRVLSYVIEAVNEEQRASWNTPTGQIGKAPSSLQLAQKAYDNSFSGSPDPEG